MTKDLPDIPWSPHAHTCASTHEHTEDNLLRVSVYTELCTHHSRQF